MYKIKKVTAYLAASCDDNPIFTTIMIFFAYVYFSLIESLVEQLLFGESFEHWFDLLFLFLFFSWSALATYICACRKVINKEGDSDE